MDAGFTMPVVYFKTGAAEPVGLRCTRDGKIDFSELGREFKLDPSSIKLNAIRIPKVGPLSEDTWEQIKADFEKEGEPLGTKEDALIVTGEVAVPAWSTGMFPTRTYSLLV